MDPPEPSQEIEEWLNSLRLSQYAARFHHGGYRALDDCKDLTDQRLVELQVLPTGHRRRILRSLEALGVKNQGGMEEDGDEEEEEEDGGGRRKPVLYPRHIFLKDKKKPASCYHRQTKETRECGSEGSQSLPPGAGLGAEDDPETAGHLRPPQPALRDPQNIRKSPLEHLSIPSSSFSSSSSSSSSESLSITDMPSDWDASPEDPTPEDPTPDDNDPGLQCEMVENAIYGVRTSVKGPKGQRFTRSYRLRHRPVPEIPKPPLLADEEWSAPPVQTTSPEHLTGSGSPTGANGIQKAPLQRTLTPIAPYGEMFLYNSSQSIPDQGGKEAPQKGFKSKIKQKRQRKKSKDSKEAGSPPAAADPGNDEYSTVEECAGVVPRASFEQGLAASPEAHAAASLVMVECDLYADAVAGAGGAAAAAAAAAAALADISPYACFYGAPRHQVLKVGWLDKLSPQGKCVFQRRWVRYDGENLAYYNNDREMYSKGMIQASGIRQVRGLGDNKFEVVTSLRTFIFRAEREGERQEWMEALQTAACPPAGGSQKRSDSLPHRRSSTNKRGLLELRGYKGRVLASLAGSKVRLCKTEQDYRAGLAISEVELTAANIRDLDRRGFEINTPFKSFCFVAESEREKEEWIEAVQESIAETLSDYEVAEKIWFNEANRSCADCRGPQPEWASVNLGVVICKKCAGSHRSLGPSISKVRSLKLDSSIWSNELVELFLEVGNKNANSFWAANLPPDEEIHSGASAEQRATFVRRKYRERKYRRVLEGFTDLEQLNRALCAAAVLPAVLPTMELLFSGADAMCATGDPACSTPYLLAQRAGQRLQMELLHQNKLSDFPRLEQWSDSASPSDASLFMDGFLYISGHAKATPDRRDLARRWCTLEGGYLSYYESERSPSAIGRVDVTEVVSLSISKTETMTVAGAVFTVELYLQTERVLVVGAETQETQQDWIQALTKCFVPPKVDGLVRRDSELVGRLLYKEGHDLYHWRTGWFALEGSELHFSAGEEEEGEEAAVLQLKQLQELTVTTHTEGEEKIQVLLMVECGRTVYIHGYSATDFSLWQSAIALAAATDGRALGDQQLTRNGVPIAMDSCVAFVTQYGLCQEGVYQRPGDPGRVALLLEEFARDARNVKLREKERHVDDVSETLKSFLSQAEDALLTKELYPYWVSALDEKDERQRVRKYSTFIESLPKINRSTLEALLQHLYRIQQCSHLNQMPSEKLASVFSSCLFQTRGQTPQEISVVRDLINNYITLFNVNEEQVQQMERENSFITRWNDKKDTSFSPAGDLIFEVYLEKREPENCCLIKVSPSMRSTELAETALAMRGAGAKDDWTTFEVIENGELERPLHHSEKILEQVLEWSGLECPRSAFLVIKKFAAEEKAERTQLQKGEYLKFNDGSSKLLSGHKFQEKYVVLHAEKLLLYRDMKSTKAEKAVQLKSVKCYLGLKKKLKPPTSFGFTVYTDKQQWHFCCEKKEVQVGWVTDIIRMKFGSDLWPARTEEAAVPATSREGAVANSRVLLPQNQNSSKQMADRRVSLGALQKTNVAAAAAAAAAAIGLRLGDALRPPETPQRRTSLDVCQPPRLPSPSRRLQSAPLPLPSAQGGCKTAGKRSALGGEVGGKMPLNLLNELNSVLNKTGRTANSND